MSEKEFIRDSEKVLMKHKNYHNEYFKDLSGKLE